MADVKAIRDRLKSALQSTTFFAYDTMPAIPMVPYAIVTPAPGVFLTEVTLDAAEDLELVVTVLVQKVVDGVAQDNADTLLSEGSPNLANLIDSGSTADWDYAVAMPARGYGQYVFGEGEGAQKYLGFEIPVRVGVS